MSTKLLMVIFIVAGVQCNYVPSNKKSIDVTGENREFGNSKDTSLSSALNSSLSVYDKNQTKVVAKVVFKDPSTLEIRHAETGITCNYTNATWIIGEFDAVLFSDWILISIRHTRDNSNVLVPKPEDVWELVFMNSTCDKNVYRVNTRRDNTYVDRINLPVGKEGIIQIPVTARDQKFEQAPGSHLITLYSYWDTPKPLFSTEPYFNNEVSFGTTLLFDGNTNEYFITQNWDSNETQIFKVFDFVDTRLSKPYVITHNRSIDYNKLAFSVENDRFTFCYGVKDNSKIITCSLFDSNKQPLFENMVVNLENNLKSMLVKNLDENSVLLSWAEGSSANHDRYLKTAIISSKHDVTVGELEETTKNIDDKELNKQHCFTAQFGQKSKFSNKDSLIKSFCVQCRSRKYCILA